MTTREPTALETYAARFDDIARLIDLLQEELEVHRRDAEDNPDRRWGRAGDLGKVRSDLIDTVAFLSSGLDREDIEAFLAE